MMDLLKAAGTAIVCDALARFGGATGLIRYDNDTRCLVGTALTVQTREGDNLAIFEALISARPGDVLVVDAAGSVDRAVVGDLARSYAIQRGVIGFIIDGAVRDVSAFRGSETFACFARGASLRGPTKDGPGRVGCPVAVGGQVIAQGDIVMADLDGLISFPTERLDEIRALVEKRLKVEAEIRAEILGGAPRQSWMDAAFAKAGKLVG